MPRTYGATSCPRRRIRCARKATQADASAAAALPPPFSSATAALCSYSELHAARPSLLDGWETIEKVVPRAELAEALTVIAERVPDSDGD
ncbi:hypothetical protein [Streptomyces sp. NPDC053720]|uniref:hypothetical protein n=1 Tax=Streptomyces sp. NPDC053720 TaxID=3154855 RepID=UPI0034138CFA